MMNSSLRLLLAAASLTAADALCGTSPGSLVEISDTLAIGVCSEGVLRIVRTPSGRSAKAALLGRKSLMADPAFPGTRVPQYEVSTSSGTTTIATDLMRATVSNGVVSFADAHGNTLTSEAGSRFTPTTDPARPHDATFVVEQSFTASDGEGLYGGGEFQNGEVGYRGAPIELVQFNTEAAVPFFS